jgi:hypothetical protein
VYHERWRARRDAEKFDRMLAFAHRLPQVRERVAADLGRRSLPREKALADAVRLLDLALFRVGSESYTRDNGSFGLATVRRDHVRTSGDVVRFDYRAKSGQRRIQEVADAEIAPIVRTLKRRRDENPELLAYRNGTGWRDVRSEDVNAYVKELAGDGFTAKDFRTWHGTVFAAVALAAAGEVPAAQAGPTPPDLRGREGGRRGARQHAGGRARLLHRPEAAGPVRGGRHDHRAARGGGRGRSRRSGVRDAVEAAVLDLLEDAPREVAAA